MRYLSILHQTKQIVSISYSNSRCFKTYDIAFYIDIALYGKNEYLTYNSLTTICMCKI